MGEKNIMDVSAPSEAVSGVPVHLPCPPIIWKLSSLVEALPVRLCEAESCGPSLLKSIIGALADCSVGTRAYKTERPRLTWQSRRLNNGGTHEGMVADAAEAGGQAPQREALAAGEREIANAGEALRQACQREGGAIFERVVADAGEAVRQAGQRDGFAVTKGAVSNVDDAVGQAGQHEEIAATEGAAADAGEACR